MKRYVLSAILGTGTEDDSFRAAVSMHPCNWGIAIAPDHQTNPNKTWVLCIVAAAETTFSTMDASVDIDVLPFGPERLPNTWLSTGTNPQRNAFANAIRVRTGVTVTRDDPRTLGEIITAVGQAVDPNFTAANLDVVDWGVI
ncbi:MAG TPA: hypothetical protein VNJ04_19735 [Gemmatimonadaceae bacterium]|nr:hypothetical protein [Gemmatimonadaceae bacterium]